MFFIFYNASSHTSWKPRYISHIFMRRYVLTLTAYKFLDIGIVVGSTSHVHSTCDNVTHDANDSTRQVTNESRERAQRVALSSLATRQARRHCETAANDRRVDQQLIFTQQYAVKIVKCVSK
ncbi:hypothetical protein ALC56_02408 [Trachymyrmex septentrionalis]|uniref:Uncharacterized protein n=1 Tax=Trachymyrmex septentrionalis TaxID=34720 RepID=A0A195FRZ7_9HYME|nr:hypothetical protein ALC56_02408 [Trachymyrmex septentrionalis]